MPAMRTKLATLLTADDPVQLIADWFLNKADRQYIDDQARTLQYHVVSSARGQIVTNPTLAASSGAVSPGDCVCLANQACIEADPMSDLRYMTKALTASMAFAGVVSGIALTAANPGAQFRMAIGGVVGNAIAAPGNVGTGIAKPVRLNLSTGRCQAVTSLSAGDYQVGFANAFGDVTLCFALIR